MFFSQRKVYLALGLKVLTIPSFAAVFNQEAALDDIWKSPLKMKRVTELTDDFVFKNPQKYFMETKGIKAPDTEDIITAVSKTLDLVKSDAHVKKVAANILLRSLLGKGWLKLSENSKCIESENLKVELARSLFIIGQDYIQDKDAEGELDILFKGRGPKTKVGKHLQNVYDAISVGMQNIGLSGADNKFLRPLIAKNVHKNWKITDIISKKLAVHFGLKAEDLITQALNDGQHFDLLIQIGDYKDLLSYTQTDLVNKAFQKKFDELCAQTFGLDSNKDLKGKTPAEIIDTFQNLDQQEEKSHTINKSNHQKLMNMIEFIQKTSVHAQKEGFLNVFAVDLEKIEKAHQNLSGVLSKKMEREQKILSDASQLLKEQRVGDEDFEGESTVVAMQKYLESIVPQCDVDHIKKLRQSFMVTIQPLGISANGVFSKSFDILESKIKETAPKEPLKVAEDHNPVDNVDVSKKEEQRVLVDDIVKKGQADTKDKSENRSQSEDPISQKNDKNPHSDDEENELSDSHSDEEEDDDDDKGMMAFL